MVYFEEGAFSETGMAGLKKKGHEMKIRSLIGDVQLIVKDGASLTGVSDPRRGGLSRGTGTAPAN